jgi:hypothetical protein
MEPEEASGQSNGDGDMGSKFRHLKLNKRLDRKKQKKLKAKGAKVAPKAKK